jgi:predicted lipid-binding transport protein (Tim44 family)
MKSLILALSVAVFSMGLAPSVADAKRIGGGGSAGMQRSVPARTAPDAAPGKPAPTAPAAAPNAAGANPAAAAPKRSWMAPLAGLAAGLGIAALMSHLGLGEELGNFVMLALLAVVAIFAIRFLIRRFGPAAPQGMKFAGAGASGANVPLPQGAANSGSASGMPAAATLAAPESAVVAPTLPAGFDAAAFERIAKMIFIRMQAANDSGDLNDLRAFTTPEMFASIKLDLQERGAGAQQTDVLRIDAQVLEIAEETERQIVSVRFHGLIREDKDGVAAPFDEVWHLVKPRDGSREWQIAGIQQTA